MWKQEDKRSQNLLQVHLFSQRPSHINTFKCFCVKIHLSKMSNWCVLVSIYLASEILSLITAFSIFYKCINFQSSQPKRYIQIWFLSHKISWFYNLVSIRISNFNIHDVRVWRILNSNYTILTLAKYFTVWSHKKHVNLRSLFWGHISHFSYPLLQQPACIIIFHPSYPQLKAPGLRSEMPVTW